MAFNDLIFSTLPNTLQDREIYKFGLDEEGRVYVRTIARPSGLGNGGLITHVELVDFEWRLLPGTALAERNAVSVQNIGPDGTVGGPIKITHEANYIADPSAFTGVIVGGGNERFYDIRVSSLIYGRTFTGTKTVIVEEVS